MGKRGLSPIQLRVLGSLAINGKQNIQEVQIREGLNYATTNRSVKMLDRLSFIWMSHKEVSRGPKGAMQYSLTPLGVVEAHLRSGIDSNFGSVLEHWGEVSPRYIHHWQTFTEVGLTDVLLKSLGRLFPDRVIINRIVSLEDHEYFRSFIQPKNFTAIRDGLDYNLLDMTINNIGLSREEASSFIQVVKSDPKYQEVWDRWFTRQQNQFNQIRKINTRISHARA